MKVESFSTIIFDLDDTLYNEIDYLKLAFGSIAKYLNKKNTLIDPNDIEKFLISTFVSNGRKNLYQKLISNFNITNFSINEYLNILRTVKIQENSISMDLLLSDFIKENILKYNFFIATNGNIIQQKNKIKSINIPHLKKIAIIYCNTFGIDGKKPAPKFINYIFSEFSIPKNKMLYIGDNKIDSQAALNGSISFCYINEFKKLIRNC